MIDPRRTQRQLNAVGLIDQVEALDRLWSRQVAHHGMSFIAFIMFLGWWPGLIVATDSSFGFLGFLATWTGLIALALVYYAYSNHVDNTFREAIRVGNEAATKAAKSLTAA